MSQSLVKIHVHIIFSTKSRYPFVDNEIRHELFKYLGGICNSMNCQSIIVGGHRDHVHILCSLPRDETLIKVIRIIKSYSSKWMKTKGSKYHKFYWQSGYGAFSINPDQIDVVRNYIAKQDEHHKTRSFKDEYRLFLKKYNFDYDERYLWD